MFLLDLYKLVYTAYIIVN